MPGAYLAHSVYGFFQNGGGVCWIVRVGGADGGQQAQAALPRRDRRRRAFLRATAREGVTDQVSIEITPEAPAAGDGEEGKADQATYRVVVTAGPQREEFDGLSLKKGRSNIATKVNAGSELITLEEIGGAAADAAPREGTYTLSVPAVEPVAVEPDRVRGRRRPPPRPGRPRRRRRDHDAVHPRPGDDRPERRRHDVPRHPGQDDRPRRGRQGPDRDPRPAARPAARRTCSSGG